VRRRAPRPLSVALGDLTGALEPATALARVQRVWREAVGEVVAQAGRPTSERDGVLTVICSDAVWSAELQMLGPQLVRQLNAALGEALIGGLRCRVG
jgi:predicted nucleic acid-binding Zn ribbon protein